MEEAVPNVAGDPLFSVPFRQRERLIFRGEMLLLRQFFHRFPAAVPFRQAAAPALEPIRQAVPAKRRACGADVLIQGVLAKEVEISPRRVILRQVGGAVHRGILPTVAAAVEVRFCDVPQGGMVRLPLYNAAVPADQPHKREQCQRTGAIKQRLVLHIPGDTRTNHAEHRHTPEKRTAVILFSILSQCLGAVLGKLLIKIQWFLFHRYAYSRGCPGLSSPAFSSMR